MKRKLTEQSADPLTELTPDGAYDPITDLTPDGAYVKIGTKIKKNHLTQGVA
jgi:hypothetical protein